MGRRAPLEWFSVLLAGLCAAGCTGAPDSSTPPGVSAGVKRIRNVAKEDTEEAVRVLAEAATHEDLATAVEAVRGLGRMRRPAAGAVLVQTARRDARPEVRMEAVVALGYREDEVAVRQLREMVEAEPDPTIRGAASAALGRAGEYEDALVLLGQVERETNLAAQAREVGALERLVGARFAFDPKASPEERRQAIERMRMGVPAMVKRLKTYAAPKRGNSGPGASG
jgi:hypothetical protein